MIKVDSCIIWFHLDCIMQFKYSYEIATNVGSRKSATTFGDLPDWWVWYVLCSLKYENDNLVEFLYGQYPVCKLY